MGRRQTAFERYFHNMHGDDLDAVQVGPSTYRAQPGAGLGRRGAYAGQARVGGKMSGAEITTRLSVGLAGLIVAIMIGVVGLFAVAVVVSMIWKLLTGG